jgi:hypothetical protein
VWQCFGCEIMHVGEAVLIAAPGGAYAANSLTARSNYWYQRQGLDKVALNQRDDSVETSAGGCRRGAVRHIAISKGIELARVWRRVNFGLSSLGSVYWPNSLCRE